MNKIFELAMLILFGISWPVSIYKSYKTKVVGSKSLFFLIAIILGYASGIINKFVNGLDYVTVFYALNMVMVTIDLVLYFRNSNIEKENNNLKEGKG